MRIFIYIDVWYNDRPFPVWVLITMVIKIPNPGFIFWPVGTGDSTTIVVKDNVFLQVDLHHMEKSEDSDDTAWAVIDELVKMLPVRNGKPYLSVFALTHPDEDHCQGYAELRSKIGIGELWLSPRTFREYRDSNADLCEDAKNFHDDAMQRVRATIAASGDPGSGKRIRIIGRDNILDEAEFQGFPEEFRSLPGDCITGFDGAEYGENFEAVVLAPFEEDSDGDDRNDCSLAFQMSLCKDSQSKGKALLMGDLRYPVIRRIFNENAADALEWNIMLAPHHCSKSAMFWKEDENSEETLKEDIIRDWSNVALSPNFVVSSSTPVPDADEPGANPPHAKAKRQYVTFTEKFICAHEHPDKDDPQPVIFEVSAESGIQKVGAELQESEPLSKTLRRLGPTAPGVGVGFG